MDVVTAPKSGGDFSAFRPDFTNYRAVVSNLDSPEWPPELESSFERYMKDGGGLVIVHAGRQCFSQVGRL